LCNKSSCADVNYLALRYIPESSTEIYRINMFQLSAFRRWQKISEMNWYCRYVNQHIFSFD